EPEPEPAFTPKNAERFVPLRELKAKSGWTVQLVAGNLEQTALSVLREYPQLGDAVYTRGERQCESWFMVFYGEYATIDAAKEAVENLPESLRNRSPWIRAIRTL
ncbi:SPOR domain-containing protein, partial [Marinobacter sp.]|uniref:SPOR domain-containing protein n=1 Tax=Marinobacter sp. TaxID=50741 RepID=UPI003297F99E